MKRKITRRAYPRWGETKRMLMIMKAMFIFLWIGTTHVSATLTYSQGVKLTMKLNDVTVDQVVKEIKKQSEFDFFYEYDLVDGLNRVSVDVEGASVEEILTMCLQGTNLDYKIQDKVIILVPAIKQKAEEVQPEKKIITGTIVDESGNPLPGASVIIKGTSAGTVTDLRGYFELELTEGAKILVVSFVGYLTEEIEIGLRKRIEMALTPDLVSLGEIVVTGYQTISAERATGSFENVQVESLLEQKTSANALDLLEGEIPGLLYENMGEGEPARISLRGLGNFNLDDSQVDDHAPLIVLDGFPINGMSAKGDFRGSHVVDVIEKMNPADIENISVLKDAAAASIWGAQAANGVIVITTKKGKKSESPRISFNSSFSIREKPNYSDAYVASVDDHLELDEWWAGAGSVSAGDRKGRTSSNADGIQAYYDYANGDISLAERDAIINGLRQNYYIKEYSDLFLRNYTQQQYNLSISQGNEKYQYRVGLNYQDEKSANKGQGNQNYGALINLSTELLKGVKLSTKVGFSKRDVQNNGLNNISSNKPYVRILDDNGDYISMTHRTHPRIVDEVYQELEPYLPFDWDYNLKREFDNLDNSTEVRNTDFQARLDIDIIKGLRAELSYDYQYGRNETREYASEEIWDVRTDIINSAVYEGGMPTGKFIIAPGGGTLDGNAYASWSNTFRGMLNYSGYLDANKEHFVTAIVGIDYRDEKYDGQKANTLYRYNPQALTYSDINNSPDVTRWDGRTVDRIYNSARLNKDHNRYLSNYTNTGYTFKDKYTLTGSWRLDDANLFGSSPKYRNVPLWSTGLKWRLAEEGFMNFSFLNRLDLRVSYGTGGRINKNASPFLTARLGNDTQTQVPKATIRDYKNEELRWEKTATTNAGVDFAMLNNRLSGSFEYYHKYTSDVLGSVSVNRTYGVRETILNYGEISNKGFDLSLNYRIVQHRDLNWDMGVLINHNVNKVERFDGVEAVYAYTATSFPLEGYGLSEVFAYRWAGLSPEDGTVQVYNENDEIIGRFDPQPTKDGLEYMGQITPKLFGNYRNRVSYKGLSLDVLLTYKFGHKFKRNTFASDFYSGNPAHEDAAKRWRQPGDEAFTDVPATTIGGRTFTYLRDGSHVFEDASHIRIQSIGLSYKVNTALFTNNIIKSVIVGVNGRNLGLLWKATDRDIDPDYGNREFTYKNRAAYSMNLKVNF